MVDGAQRASAALRSLQSSGSRGVGTEPDSARRIQILNEAALLFRERGFEATSMREIAGRVGVSKPALYHWFAKKEDILVGIVLEAVEQLCLRTEQAIAKSPLPEQQIKLFFQAQLEYIDSNLAFDGAAFAAFAALPKTSARAVAVRWRDRHERNLRSILTAGVKRGDFADLDVKLTSRAILAALSAVSVWYNPRGKLTAIEIASEYAALFLDGIRTKTRKKRVQKKRGRSAAAAR